MTERRPAGLGYESWIDRQISEAEKRGKFDDLPTAGKPLPDLGRSDENWWIKGKLRGEGLSSGTAETAGGASATAVGCRAR
jgi:hypothetical protein